MDKGHTPYGYRIINGAAVIDEKKADQVRKLCEGYLAGMGLAAASQAAGIRNYHTSAMRMMLNRHYAGDDFYPAILAPDLQEKIRAERQRRSAYYGRDTKPPSHKPADPAATRFQMMEADQHLADPYAQAEYLYSLIRRTG